MYVPGPAGYKDGPAAAPVWNGPYVGINGGYAWGGNSDVTATQNPVTIDPAFAPSGAFGGGQIGYNWQGYSHPQLVLGIEADIQGADINGSGTVSGLPASAQTNLDWFGTVRGRVGYSVGAALLYGTGGFAYGGVKDKLTVSGTTVQHDATATGYAAGGGLEYAFNPAWSAKAEYQYINLGTDSLTENSGGVTGNAKFDHEYNTVRLGLNYHVLPGYEPLK
jgi:outer membrane immunogenic protein